MKEKVKAKSPGYSTGLSESALFSIVKTTTVLARECSKSEDKRLKEYLTKNAYIADKV
ncbi:hypothetical protein [Serratia symbiotica]|uniref:hypothetical protein n=1 Tax=Serratia symbiotica TaxID=138074 RepID=UPI001321AA00|nr:hypothetical protein [Serratia symbiotica]QTP14798.1 hypothetical protein GPZ83_0001835 [Serratia symbiotica]